MLRTLLALALAVAPGSAVVRFHCSQLVVERLDPLVEPGNNPSSHLHQIVGGNSFNATMDPKKDMPKESSCTTCQFSDDFSNYWTATLYFRATNGSYKRVRNIGNNQFEKANGGLTVYYMQDAIYDQAQKSKVTAFQPGFRMFVGNVHARTLEEATRFRQLTYVCMDTWTQRAPESIAFPNRPCKEGIMAGVRFPTCWDGKNLDSPDHMQHMSYPKSGTFESGGPCPASHPVRTSQVFFEVIWDTKEFNKDWPVGGKNPFVWSFGDETGYANHGDYVFGWKGDTLQRILDTPCAFTCPKSAGFKTQSVDSMNKCAQKSVVNEQIDGWLPSLPGMAEVDYAHHGSEK